MLRSSWEAVLLRHMLTQQLALALAANSTGDTLGAMGQLQHAGAAAFCPCCSPSLDGAITSTVVAGKDVSSLSISHQLCSWPAELLSLLLLQLPVLPNLLPLAAVGSNTCRGLALVLGLPSLGIFLVMHTGPCCTAACCCAIGW